MAVGLEDTASPRLRCEHENVLGQASLVLAKQMSTRFVNQGSSVLCLAMGTKKALSQLWGFASLVNSFEVVCLGFLLFKENFLLCLLSNNKRSDKFTSCGVWGLFCFL